MKKTAKLNQSLLYQAAKNFRSGPIEGKKFITNENKKNAVADAHRVAENDIFADAILEALFPDDVPSGASFFEVLKVYLHRLGYFSERESLCGSLLLGALRSIKGADREALLMAGATSSGHFSYEVVRQLSRVVRAFDLPAKFCTTWFKAIADKLGGSSLYNLWGVVHAYCEKPSRGIELIRLVEASDRTDAGRETVREAMAAVRNAKLSKLQKEQFNKLEGEFRESRDQWRLRAYWDSWGTTSGCRALSDVEVLAIITGVPTFSPDDLAFAAYLACRILRSRALSEANFSRLIDWMLSFPPHLLNDLVRHQVAVATALPGEGLELTDEARDKLWSLLEFVQPIPARNNRSWSNIERYLVFLHQSDSELFERRLTSLALAAPDDFSEVLGGARSEGYLISEMQQTEPIRLVSRLMFARAMGSRRLGLVLFEKLHLDAFDPTILAATDDRTLKAALAQFRISPIISAQTTVNFLMALSERAEVSSEEFRLDFGNELLFQSKNFRVGVFDVLSASEKQPEVVKGVLAAAKSYYDALEGVSKSEVLAMDIPHFGPIASAHLRDTRNKIRAHAMEASVFGQFAPEVEMIYGNQYTHFSDSNLTPPSGYSTYSHEFEMPRLAFLEPEEVSMRRLNAIEYLQNFEEGSI